MNSAPIEAAPPAGDKLHDADTTPGESSHEPRLSSEISALTRGLRKLLKGKDKEWNSVSRRSGRLTLLELPLDVLRLIVNEVTHTNDLSALALTNSILYNLAIPHIYSRFDIVWPDATQLTQSDSKSVDALTYGLSTLCLGNSFAYRARSMFSSGPAACRATPRRLKNDYASFVKKFSLGNGPEDWVAEYAICKESGKMLGTLVALAVAKMTNLETFVWDMPTGVLSDIFMALASISDAYPDGESKLSRVWVRWHDNSDNPDDPPSASNAPTLPPQALAPLGSTMTPIGVLVPADAETARSSATVDYADSKVEFPTFSILPSLKSLSVLDIDELSYVDEMAAVIERSQHCLEELRVGIAQKAKSREFAQPWDGPGLQQLDHIARWPGESTAGERRLGGILGVLVGRVYDIRKTSKVKTKDKRSSTVNGIASTENGSAESNGTGGRQLNHSEYRQRERVDGSPEAHVPDPPLEAHQEGAGMRAEEDDKNGVGGLDGKLRLKSLELERVPLSIHVCKHAIDWTTLTSLTLLDCMSNESLWRGLRKHFHPITPADSKHHHPNTVPQYSLALKSIHTDLASPALLSFLKETLAPNSLEVLFLQDRRRALPTVTIDQIFKGPIKRHRASLRKLLIDSGDVRAYDVNASDSIGRWREWTATGDMVMFVTSGRMSNLRELSMCLHYCNWHTFLQRLPNIPHLRSLHLPKIADHATQSVEPRELALQMVDIISLRPEIQLSFIGIKQKCFEVLEFSQADLRAADHESRHSNQGPGHSHTNQGGASNDASDDDDDDEPSEAETSDSEDTPFNANNAEAGDPDAVAHADDEVASVDDADDMSSDTSSVSDAESSQDGDHMDRPRLKLREILFYDDRVAIFKARHGKL